MAEEAAPSQRPPADPSHGVFETMLVVDGHPRELEPHLGRLAASVRLLYGVDPPGDLRELILGEAPAGGLGRVRVTVAPDRDGGLRAQALGAAVDPASIFPSGARAASLVSMTVDEGLGDHKWADRALLERAEAIGPPEAVPLLLAGDGAVLEASRANVFAVLDGEIVTPPLDGRILPGVTRARVIEIAGENGLPVREEPIVLERLLSAEEAFLTGSVRGVEPVATIDGTEIARPERTSRILARDLRRRWLGS